MFKEIAHSWLKQSADISMIENLKKFDITNSPEMIFLSTKEILDLEKKYNVSLSNIIMLSYEQEAKNTKIIREKDPSYNPYTHEEMVQSNETIKRLANMFPEANDVLDLGCYEGTRTLDLYSEKNLYGIEFIEEFANESKNKGIQVYRGSMIDNFYKDQKYPNGRRFDIVSIVGEMINFVGLDTDKLLSSAIKQVEDKGALLVSCMHYIQSEKNEDEYVIWSFKEPNEKKWVLKEEKIPRAFLVISRKELLEKVEDIARSQNCSLELKGEEVIDNYYKNIPLSVYIFQKKL